MLNEPEPKTDEERIRRVGLYLHNERFDDFDSLLPPLDAIARMEFIVFEQMGWADSYRNISQTAWSRRGTKRVHEENFYA